MTFDVTQIILALIALCGALVTSVLVPWGEGKDDNGAAGAAGRMGQDCSCRSGTDFRSRKWRGKEKVCDSLFGRTWDCV